MWQISLLAHQIYAPSWRGKTSPVPLSWRHAINEYSCAAHHLSRAVTHQHCLWFGFVSMYEGDYTLPLMQRHNRSLIEIVPPDISS